MNYMNVLQQGLDRAKAERQAVVDSSGLDASVLVDNSRLPLAAPYAAVLADLEGRLGACEELRTKLQAAIEILTVLQKTNGGLK